MSSAPAKRPSLTGLTSAHRLQEARHVLTVFGGAWHSQRHTHQESGEGLVGQRRPMSLHELHGLRQPLPPVNGAAGHHCLVWSQVFYVLHGAHLYLRAAFDQGFANDFGHASGGTGPAGVDNEDRVRHRGLSCSDRLCHLLDKSIARGEF